MRSAAGWLDLADRAILSVSGPDSVEWLQGMLSNDVEALDPGEGIPAAILNIQGKILADVRVLRTADAFLLELDEPLAAGALEHLNRYLIADEVELSNLSDELAVISIQGPEAETALSRLLEVRSLPAGELGHEAVECAGERLRVVRATHTGEPGFDLVAARGRVAAMAGLPQARRIPWIGSEARETLRIEAGIPRYGVDMDADTLLLETCLDAAVSFTKGCYLGQETVERIHSRGRVNRKLVGLMAEGDTVPVPSDPVLVDELPVGRVTSAAGLAAVSSPHRPRLRPSRSHRTGQRRPDRARGRGNRRLGPPPALLNCPAQKQGRRARRPCSCVQRFVAKTCYSLSNSASRSLFSGIPPS